MNPQFQNLTGREPYPVLPLLSEEDEKRNSPESVAEFYSVRKQAMILAQHDPLRYGYEPAIWKLADKHREELRKKFPSGVIYEINLGGNRCLHGSTKIYDPVAKISLRVDEIDKPFHVYAWNGNRVVIAEASSPFKKGLGKMRQIRLSNGVAMILATTHQVLSAKMEWVSVSSLERGDGLFLPASTSDICQSVHVSSVHHYAGTVSGSPNDYQIDNCLCDGQLLLEEDTVRDVFPLPAGVPKRISVSDNIRRWLWRLYSSLYEGKSDDLDNRLLHNLPSLKYGLLTILDDLHQLVGRFAGILYRAFYKPCRSALPSLEHQDFSVGSEQSVLGFDLPESIPEFYQQGSEYNCGVTYITEVTPAGIDVKWDFTVSTHGNYFCGGVLHHNSAKSKRAAKRVVQDLVHNPGRKWWCCDSTEAMSRENQQLYIQEFLPPEWRNLKSGRITKLRWSLSGGFTENNFVLPNSSMCHFKFYEMDIKNLPGPELDGVFADELIPPEWIEVLTYRLTNRNGIFHITFTPEQGYTPTVGLFLDESKIVEEVEAELLPIKDRSGKVVGHEKVPRIVFCHDEAKRIIYFHTKDNPFGNYEGMKSKLAHVPKEEIKMRAYGVCEKAAYAQFHVFSEKVHVISMNRFEEILKTNPDGTRFHLVDPCSGRNWFMIWIYCPAPGKKIIYREWPSHTHIDAYIPGIGDPGPWAILGEPADGKAGQAQNPFASGLEYYKEEILRVENKEEIYERWIDSRFSNSPMVERERTTTLIEQLEELDLFFLAMVSETRILGVNDGSIDMIRSALRYDKNTPLGEFSPELSRLNEPNLLVTENCPNTIFSMKHWTGRDGNKGACKDPIDCVRGAVLSELDFVDEKMLKPRSDWGKQFQRR